MRSVFIMTDLEGVAGVVSFDKQTAASSPYHDNARRLLTAEVNAAVEGLLEAGVEDVLIADGHGGGAIWYEDLHERARLLHGNWFLPRDIRDAIFREFDACANIGQHAMAGTRTGNLNHTQNHNTIDYYKLNGKPIGEIAQFALYMGGLGVPAFFLSGDEAACREAEELVPAIKTAAVKQGVSRNGAISLSAPCARRLIKEGIRDAVESFRANPIEPLVWPGPYVLEKRFFASDTADAVANGTKCERVDSQTVRLHRDDICEIVFP